MSLPRCSLAVLASVVVVAAGCGQRAGGPSRSAGAAVDPPARVQQARAAAGSPSAAMRFAPHRCVDSEGLGIEAFNVLVPQGWKFTGGIRWRLDNPAFPAYASCRVEDSAGLVAFEVFPNLPCFWTNNPMVAGMFPPGSKYFGSTVHQPLGAADALSGLVLPAFRSGVDGLEITGGGQVPELAAMVQEMQARAQPEAGIRADAAKVRIRYTADGRAFDEEMYAVVQVFAYPLGPSVTNVNWWVDYIFSFRAPAGRLDEAAGLLQTVAFSFRPSPRWVAGYANVVQYLIRAQIQQIRQIGEIGRIYAQTGSEIREDQMRTWEANQAVRDRLADDWSRQFRGYEQYWDPSGERMVDLPSGYDNAWVNGLGEVVVSEDPSFNPNVGSNQSWQPMPKK